MDDRPMLTAFADLTERAQLEHMTTHHDIEEGWAQEAAAANYCATVAEYHDELHRPEFYEHTPEQALPDHVHPEGGEADG